MQQRFPFREALFFCLNFSFKHVKNEFVFTLREPNKNRFSFFAYEHILINTVQLGSAFLYFKRVALPPRRWRSARFFAKTAATLLKSIGSAFFSLPVRSLCTVLLLIPNLFAAARTVAPLAATNSPTATARSFMSEMINKKTSQ